MFDDLELLFRTKTEDVYNATPITEIEYALLVQETPVGVKNVVSELKQE